MTNTSFSEPNKLGLTITFAGRGARWVRIRKPYRLLGINGFSAHVDYREKIWTWRVCLGEEVVQSGEATEKIQAMQRACRAMLAAGG